MKIFKLSLGAFLLTSALGAADINIAGSKVMYPFTYLVGEKFKQKYKFKATSEGLGSSAGFKYLCDGEIDIASSTRPMKLSEYKTCQKNGVTEVVGLKVGYGALIFSQGINDKPLDLTSEQLFFALVKEIPQNGKLVPNPYKKWNQISKDLPDMKISIFGPTTATGIRSQIEDILITQMAKKYPEYPANYVSIRQDGYYHPVGEEGVEDVYENNTDRGFFSYSTYIKNTDKLIASKIDGIVADEQNIIKEKYMFSRPIYLYINIKKHPKEALDFAELMLTDQETRDELSKEGLIWLSVKDYKENIKNLRKKRLINEDLVNGGGGFINLGQ